MKRLKLSDIEAMNDVNLEKDQMEQIFGGRPNGGGCTMDTVTCTPNGVKLDGDDSFDGECNLTIAPRSYRFVSRSKSN